ncbi:MAG: M15 family metallopeptidase [Oscillospiraceae bacterium]|nr:M15 family metallopeptidase [Oscillospiraceae bacterium]
MVNSRDTALLREDVEANVHIWLRLCEAEGLQVLITQTVRDDAYQAYLYAQGRTKPGQIVTNSRRTTFHGAGLAVDFCKNVKGQEYSDAAFFDRVIEIAKEVGFSSGADWKSFPEKCHIQWDYHGQYSGSMITAGRLPPLMPIYERSSADMITMEDVKSMSEETTLALWNKIQNVLGEQEQTGKVGEELREAVEMGITDGSRPKAACTRAQAAVMVKRAVKGE